MDKPVIDLADVTVRYGSDSGSTLALDHTDLRVGEGDFVALVGPSGCGKSTILKLAAGLIGPTSGGVIVGGREMGAAGTQGIRIGLAFQNPTMLPWLTIRENVMIPLKIVRPFRNEYAKKKRGEFADRAEALLAQVGLRGFGDRRPWQLSGGMLQRASLCRALIHDPQLLLLDEPFGALDNQTRALMQELLLGIWERERKTVLFVTHDIEEAIFLASRVVVMSARPGRIKAELQVPLPHPRHYTMKTGPEFSALKARLTEEIRVEAVLAAAH